MSNRRKRYQEGDIAYSDKTVLEDNDASVLALDEVDEDGNVVNSVELADIYAEERHVVDDVLDTDLGEAGRPPDIPARARRMSLPAGLTLKQKAYLIAYSYYGVHTKAASASKVTMREHHRWLKDSPLYAEAFEISQKM